MAKGRPDVKTKRLMGGYLHGARAGQADCRWLHALIVKAGYAPVAKGDEEAVLANTRQLARLLGVTRATIQNWRREGLPTYRESAGNQPTLFEIGAAIAWRVEREKTAAKRARDTGVETDEVSEAIRREKLRAARRENDMDEGKLVEAAKVGTQLTAVARIFRQEAEALERAHGREVGDAVRGMIDRSEAEWRKLFSNGRTIL